MFRFCLYIRFGFKKIVSKLCLLYSRNGGINLNKIWYVGKLWNVSHISGQRNEADWNKNCPIK